MALKPCGSCVKQAVALGVDPVLDVAQQRRMAARAHLGIAELVHGAGLDAAAELRRHGLHAVADAEHWHAELPDRGRRGRRARLRDGLRPPGEDDRAWVESQDVGVAGVPGMDLAVHPELADPACDQLGVLGAEVKYQDAVRVDVTRGRSAHGTPAHDTR
jgi:hypothetical protein